MRLMGSKRSSTGDASIVNGGDRFTESEHGAEEDAPSIEDSHEDGVCKNIIHDYVPAQKRLMDRMNSMLGEQHLKNWYLRNIYMIFPMEISAFSMLTHLKNH
jgi:hypothetical protein